MITQHSEIGSELPPLEAIIVEKNLDALLCLGGPVGSRIRMDVQGVGLRLWIVETNCRIL